MLDTRLSIQYDSGMARKPKLISEQLREAMLAADVSRYRIAKDIGVTEALLSRFMNGVAGLGQETIDKIGEYLGLELVQADKPKARKAKPKGR
jgi:plasmid maintenance system antidote protein VapI